MKPKSIYWGSDVRFVFVNENKERFWFNVVCQGHVIGQVSIIKTIDMSHSSEEGE